MTIKLRSTKTKRTYLILDSCTFRIISKGVLILLNATTGVVATTEGVGAATIVVVLFTFRVAVAVVVVVTFDTI